MFVAFNLVFVCLFVDKKIVNGEAERKLFRRNNVFHFRGWRILTTSFGTFFWEETTRFLSLTLSEPG